MERSFTALVYRLAHPGSHHGPYRAECVQYPGLVGNGATPAAAVSALRSELLDVVRSEVAETPGDAILTSITILSAFPQSLQAALPPAHSGASASEYTYAAVVTPDTEGLFAAYCPALGVASDGVTVDDALMSLRDAATLYLVDQPAPSEDVRVHFERVVLTLPDPLLTTAQPRS